MAGGNKKDNRLHRIVYDYVPDAGILKVRSVCICDKFVSPLYFGFERAEDQGRDHLFTVGAGGRPPRK